MSDNTAEKQQEELDLEVEIIDDVPEEDKNKVRNEDAPKDNIPDDEEIKQYSKDVQKRLNKIKYEYHEERRLKEAAEREKEEAVNNLQKLLDENKKLRKTLDDGEGVLVEQAKKRVGAEIDSAKKEYKEAYESGDPDKILEAQEKLSRAQNEQFKVESYKPQVRTQDVSDAPKETAQPKAKEKYEPTAADKKWLEQNSEWFNKDGYEDMTGYVYGIHSKLVKAKINPILEPDEYYRRVDEGMRKHFPEYFNKQDVETEEVDAPQRPAGTVVAPVNRSAKKPRKVQLTSTQISLANRLGLTPEQYAQQLLKESTNG
tara:strand:- start:455 stop:1399 length:945 start_codon:yes stop_codon:yes gene_type:complete